MIVLVEQVKWEIRQEGILSLVGAEHITIRLDLANTFCYSVWYKEVKVGNKGYTSLSDAQAHAMMLPALLFDFGLEA